MCKLYGKERKDKYILKKKMKEEITEFEPMIRLHMKDLLMLSLNTLKLRATGSLCCGQCQRHADSA